MSKSCPANSVRWAGAATGLLLAVMASWPAVGQTNGTSVPPAIPRRPNIILILADELGLDEFGVDGRRNVPTPNLDALAAGGVKFTGFYSASPEKGVARRSLLTGLHTGSIFGPPPNNAAASNHSTVATLLQTAGYRTGCIGEWAAPGVPQRSGFNEWLGFMTENEALATRPQTLWRFEPGGRIGDNGGREDFEGQVQLGPTSAEPELQAATDIFTTAAINFIKIRKPDSFNKYQPFFLLLGYPTPRVAPTDNVSPYHDRPWTAAEKARAAAIARLDADVGKIVEALETYKQTSNTLIILTSDNAPARQANAKNGGGGIGLREKDLRVPLVVRCPGMVAAKQVNDQPWAAWDILPTLVSVGRAQMPPLTDGISLWPLLTGAPQASRHDFLFWEYRDNNDIQQAVRTREWKAIKPHPDKPVELYNLSADPGEKTDVARSHVGELAPLENILMRYQPAGSPKSP